MPAPEGFVHRDRGDDVVIFHHGRVATVLRGPKATGFRADVAELAHDEAQELMARLTGNYRRGNERTARSHPRNRT